MTLLPSAKWPPSICLTVGIENLLIVVFIIFSGRRNENPFRYVRNPKAPESEVHVYTDEECACLVKAARDRRILSRRSSKITSKSFSTSTMTDSGPPMVPCTRGSGISSKRTCAAVIYISDSCGSGAVTQTVATRPSGLCRSLERPVGCVRVAGRSAPCSGLSAWSRRSCRTYRTLNSS